MFFAIYLLTGALAGMVAGLFGLGGGIVIIPILVMVLPHVGIPNETVMQVAIATSLATVIVTTAIATHAQWKKNNIDWAIFKKALLPIAAGSFTSALLAQHISSQWLAILFAALLLFVAYRMLLARHVEYQNKPFPNTFLFSSVAFFLAMLSAVAGLGGGVLFLPYLHHCGLTMLRSSGTTAALTLVIASVATVTYASLGKNMLAPLPMSIGYIYLPAFFGVIITSVVFATVGVTLAHRLPVPQLKKGFAVLLILIAIKMLITF